MLDQLVPADDVQDCMAAQSNTLYIDGTGIAIMSCICRNCNVCCVLQHWPSAAPQQVSSKPDHFQMCAGFVCLPPDVQALILSRVRTTNNGAVGMVQTCHAFEAHAFLNARRATHLTQNTSLLSGLTALPFSPHLQTLQCKDQRYGDTACAMLAATPRVAPRLTDLVLHAYSCATSAAIAAVTNTPQLTKLKLYLWAYWDDDPRWPPSLPLHQLPLLHVLLDLHLDLEVTGTAAEAWVALGLDNLANLRQLTQLCVSVGDRFGGNTTPAFATAAMLLVAAALTALMALCRLFLDGWASIPGPAARACWLALVDALPGMLDLAHLSLTHLRLEESKFDPACIVALASSLACLSSLQTLAITGPHSGWGHYMPALTAHDDDCRAASLQLAAAVGALAGLQTLALCKLHRCLNEQDFYLQIRGLTRLTSLGLWALAPAVLPGETGGAAALDGNDMAGMLSGLTRLERLELADARTRAHTRLCIFSALPTLPSLVAVTIRGRDGDDHAACVVLAQHIQAGRLPRLQVLCVQQNTSIQPSPSWLALLNQLAARDVFHHCP